MTLQGNNERVYSGKLSLTYEFCGRGMVTRHDQYIFGPKGKPPEGISGVLTYHTKFHKGLLLAYGVKETI